MSRALTTRWRSVLVATTEQTQPSSPLVTGLSFGGPVILDHVTFRIPAGHRGSTGLQLQLAGSTIFPYNAPTEWLVGDDDRLTVDFGVEVDTQLQVVTYNLDRMTHRHFLDISVSDIPVDTINAGATAALTGLS